MFEIGEAVDGRLAGRDDRRHDESEEDRARRAERVLELVRDGEISRAMRLLHSMGIAGVTEDVLSQMRRKHPPRQHSVPQQLPGLWSSQNATQSWQPLGQGC